MQKWPGEFRIGTESFEGEQTSGCRPTATTEKKDCVHHIVIDDRCLTKK